MSRYSELHSGSQQQARKSPFVKKEDFLLDSRIFFHIIQLKINTIQLKINTNDKKSIQSGAYYSNNF